MLSLELYRHVPSFKVLNPSWTHSTDEENNISVGNELGVTTGQ